jgi:hypothetical protein
VRTSPPSPASSGANGEDVLFTCPEAGCGRRLIVKRHGGLIVLDQGDFFARHRGGTEGLEISAGIAR